MHWELSVVISLLIPIDFYRHSKTIWNGPDQPGVHCHCGSVPHPLARGPRRRRSLPSHCIRPNLRPQTHIHTDPASAHGRRGQSLSMISGRCLLQFIVIIFVFIGGFFCGVYAFFGRDWESLERKVKERKGLWSVWWILLR